MLKKIYNSIFVIAFLAVLFTPLILTKWESGGVSADENRNLAPFPAVTQDGAFNNEFTTQFETWFKDHMGLRQEMIVANTALQFQVFDRMLDNSNYHIGPHGDLNYATEEMLRDYAHLNIRTDYWVGLYGDSYQKVSDYLAEQDVDFYYVQCYDKHSIYPEQFTDKIKQVGDVSKTDQLIRYLEEETSVNVISLKQPLLEAKKKYEVYSNWGDPTHWAPRGAFVGYQYMMDRINKTQTQQVKVLQEEDYEIEIKQGGITLNQVIHRDDYFEFFTLKSPKAQLQDNTVMGKWADQYHKVWKNPEAGNDTKVLLLCDSYFDSYIAADIAESYGEVWLIWADYIGDLPQILEIYDADMVIFECAERVDRSYHVRMLAESLNQP